MALDALSRHELWRLQLLDELRRKRAALEYQPRLDPDGRHRAALGALIAYFEEVQAAEKLPRSEAVR